MSGSRGLRGRRRTRFKKLLYRPEAALLAMASFGLRPLGVRNQLRVGAALGWLFWSLSPRRNRAIENVGRCLDADRAEARRIARAAHVHLGRLLVELLTSTSYLEPERAALLELEDFDHLQSTYDEGAGVVLVTAHLGNWELLAIKQALENIPLLAIGREPNNPYVARRLHASRRLCGNRWLPRERAMFQAARGLKSGRCVATAIDQHTRSQPKMTGDFLGRPADLATAAFELAVRFKSPVVPCVTLPKPHGGYRIVYYPPIRAIETGSHEERVRELASRCHRLVETWIRERPETWFWFHDLWKTGPSAAGDRASENRRSALKA